MSIRIGGIVAREPQYSWVNLYRLHLVPHKFHIVGSGFSPWPPRLKNTSAIKKVVDIARGKEAEGV